MRNGKEPELGSQGWEPQQTNQEDRLLIQETNPDNNCESSKVQRHEPKAREPELGSLRAGALVMKEV